VPGVRLAERRAGAGAVPLLRPAGRGRGRPRPRPDRRHDRRTRAGPRPAAGHPARRRRPRRPPRAVEPPAVAPPPPPPAHRVVAPPPAPPPPPVDERLPLPPPRRVSPQQVLLGLGALLVVAAGIAFVAVAWTRLGLVFQSVVMATVTATACGVSGWTARRGPAGHRGRHWPPPARRCSPSTSARRTRSGSGGLDAVPARLWTAVSCGVVAAAALGSSRSDPAAPSPGRWAPCSPSSRCRCSCSPRTPPPAAAGVAAALGVALLDVVVLLLLRRVLAPVARVLAAAWAAVGGGRRRARRLGRDGGRRVDTTALLAAAGAVGLLLRQDARLGPPAALRRPSPARPRAVTALALTGALARADLARLGSPRPGWAGPADHRGPRRARRAASAALLPPAGCSPRAAVGCWRSTAGRGPRPWWSWPARCPPRWPPSG
jgi:hypothetical protein